MATIVSIVSKARPKLSNGSPRKASSRFPETVVRKQPADGVPFRSPSKGPVRRTILPKSECEKDAFVFRSRLMAALRDTAHELGLGCFAGSNLALAEPSIVPDAGDGCICRDHRSDHAASLGAVRGEQRACAGHAA